MLYIPINNPREENGDFGPWRCGKCGSNNPAFVRMVVKAEFILLCKQCLQDGIDLIDQTILKDAVEKGLKKR
jgi:hypothetical protein